MVNLNDTNSEAFKLLRSIRQGCPIAPFLFFFEVDCLRRVLEKDNRVQGIHLPNSNHLLKDCEFVDDTNWYLAGNLQNLNNAKETLALFSMALGAKINWNKSTAIWVSSKSKTFEWETKDSLKWLQPGKMTRYQGFRQRQIQRGTQGTPEKAGILEHGQAITR